MFDVGSTEILFLLLVGVIVLGPQRLPAVAKTLGNWVRRGRRMAQEFQTELEKEVDLQEFKKIQQEITEQAEPLKDMAESVQDDFSILDPKAKQAALDHEYDPATDPAKTNAPSVDGSDAQSKATISSS